MSPPPTSLSGSVQNSSSAAPKGQPFTYPMITEIGGSQTGATMTDQEIARDVSKEPTHHSRVQLGGIGRDFRYLEDPDYIDPDPTLIQLTQISIG
jgi:hypothetical protein